MASAPRILLVDDDPSVLRLAQFNLEQDGFVVDVATDGQAALEVFEAGEYDLLLLDLMMPGLNGLEVLARVRADEQRGDLPVFLLTARGNPEDREEAERLGASGYLRKPFDPEELTKILRGALDPS